MAIKLGIIGCAGRMGRRIASLANEDQNFSLTCAIERADHPSQGVDLGELLGLGKLDLGDLDLSEGKRLARRAVELIENGVVGYTLITARRA